MVNRTRRGVAARWLETRDMLVLVPISISAAFGALAAWLALGTEHNPLFWGALGACLGVVLVYPFRSYRVGTLDPSFLASLCSESIQRSRRIRIPGHGKAYNPSLIRHGDGYLLSFRVRHYDLRSFIRKIVNVRTSYAGIVRLDANFEVCSAPHLLRIQSYSIHNSESVQDGRLIRFGEKVLLIFNDYGGTRNRASCALYVVALGGADDALQPEGAATMLTLSGMNRVEKNWVPFVDGGQLFLIYSTEPHRVLRADLVTGACDEIACTNATIPWQWGTIRGGTPACLIEGGFLSIFHSSQFQPAHTLFGRKLSRSYAMGAYVFADAHPFAVAAITPPLGNAAYYAENRRKVVFPGGAVIDRDDLHVVWGKNDTQVWISTFNLGRLRSSMLAVGSHR